MNNFPKHISGVVAHGKRLGRQIGFPTANVELEKFDAQFGVYLVKVEQTFGIANIGTRPTVTESKRIFAEVHLLDVDQVDLYGQEITIQLLALIRCEQKFESVEQLRIAIKNDEKAARILMASDFKVADI